MNAATPHRTRALVLCDADSYLKWGVSRALDLSAAADVEVVVVRSAVTPSRAQVRDAVAGRWPDVPLLSLDEVASRLEADAPDVLVLAVRGPLVEPGAAHGGGAVEQASRDRLGNPWGLVSSHGARRRFPARLRRDGGARPCRARGADDDGHAGNRGGARVAGARRRPRARAR
nr:DUF6716 putative glycosyltransferase [Demequina litorisediminis]